MTARMRYGWAALACLVMGASALAQEAEEPVTEDAAAEEPAVEEAAEDTVAEEAVWRDILPENLITIATSKGTITIELNPGFAPAHASRMRELAASGAFDGRHFYRVIEGFVAQAGLQDEDEISLWEPLKNENDRPYGGEGFVPLGNDDLFAPEVGHIDGFPVGRSEELGQEWLLHCPGAVAMARDTDPDSGGTEIYIVLDAQRYLDRNLTVFGRVIDGMEHVQAFKRGKREIESGVIQAPELGEEMQSVEVVDNLLPADRPQWQVMDTATEAFEDFKTSKRVREEDFFYRKPPEVLDICSFSAPVRRAPQP